MKSSDRFVKQLIAVFSKWPVTPNTAALYRDKLAKWRMSDAQFDKALDALIEADTDGSLPALKQVYGVLAAQWSPDYTGRHFGKVFFTTRDGNPNNVIFIEIIRDEGSTVCVYDPTKTDIHGKLLYGDKGGSIPELPEGHYNVIVKPDNPAAPPPEELPTPAEVRELVSRTVAGMGRK